MWTVQFADSCWVMNLFRHVSLLSENKLSCTIELKWWIWLNPITSMHLPIKPITNFHGSTVRETLIAFEDPFTMPTIHFIGEYTQYLAILPSRGFVFFNIIGNSSFTIIHIRNFSHCCSLHSWVYYDDEHTHSSVPVPCSPTHVNLQPEGVTLKWLNIFFFFF